MSKRRATQETGAEPTPEQEPTQQGQAAGAEPPQPPDEGPQLVKLTKEQTLGVQLIALREAVKGKNTEIAQLTLDNATLKNQLMEALNRSEDAMIAGLSTRFGLPTGPTHYSAGEDGLYTYHPVEPT